jgi:hypothetical protein
MDTAIRKASARRLMADWRTACAILATAQRLFSDRRSQVAYLIGALDNVSSATVRACLFTAIGG